ncbi:DNA-directed DNA polymerase delta subunit POL31 [Sporobolomyces salmoneus]|uniref:DNA-directed DNA polymerase delta subunit POL31 n=1 Tax=Sporobolomyces salmoneus TaxID=183962 RepID=UPI0031733AAE
MATRSRSILSESTNTSFTTVKNDKQFSQQYANLYWLRLVVLRKRLEERAREKWEGKGKLQGVSTPPKHVKRLLEVENGKLCYVLGTLYVDMPLKPNVLEDLARDHHITAPPKREKYHSKSDEIMLEDESGRVRLVGTKIIEQSGSFVTGTIIACLGAETSSGDFEVFEFIYCGMPPQSQAKSTPTTMEDDDGEGEGEWVALASGMEMGNEQMVGDLKSELLVEWLNGEIGDQEDSEEATKISRLVLAGNSLAQPDLTVVDDSKKKRYGYDSSLYSSKPTAALDQFLSQLCPTLPVDLMPGEKDPTAPTMPQQVLHPALLPNAAVWENFNGRTNPWSFEVNGTTFLGTSGQTIDDVFKYLSSQDRLEIAQETLEWSHIAPTCPDTLWCYPFTDRDPFILSETPHVYFIGNQPKFETRLVEQDNEGGKKRVRIVLVPKFCETGQVVLVNTKSLDVKVVKFEA